MQKNWIGKSVGAELSFPIIKDQSIPNCKAENITVFTTRPDTVMGLTYLVLAPEHRLVDELTTAENKAVSAYRKEAAKKTEIERTAEGKTKTGVALGSYLTNPFNGEKIPVLIADYALVDYGTGAMMAVPAHDQRDYDFAKAFNLPLKPVIAPKELAEEFSGDELTVKMFTI